MPASRRRGSRSRRHGRSVPGWSGTRAIPRSGSPRAPACRNRSRPAWSRCWRSCRSPPTPCRARAACERRKNPGSQTELSVQLENRLDRHVTHLRIEVTNRRILAVVFRADAFDPQRDRLRDRLVLQRTRDSAPADAWRRSGEGGPGKPAHRWVLDRGQADDGIALARDPQPVGADARVFEPHAVPLVIGHLLGRHRGRDVVLGGIPHLVQLGQSIGIDVAFHGHHAHVLRSHPLAALLGGGQETFAIGDEVELPLPGATRLIVSTACENSKLVLALLADARYSDRASLAPQPGFGVSDQVLVAGGGPVLGVHGDSNRTETPDPFDPCSVPRHRVGDRHAVVFRDRPRAYLTDRVGRPPEALHDRISWVFWISCSLQVGHELRVRERYRAQFEIDLGCRHQRTTSLALSIRLISAPCLGERSRGSRVGKRLAHRPCASRCRPHRGASATFQDGDTSWTRSVSCRRSGPWASPRSKRDLQASCRIAATRPSCFCAATGCVSSPARRTPCSITTTSALRSWPTLTATPAGSRPSAPRRWCSPRSRLVARAPRTASCSTAPAGRTFCTWSALWSMSALGTSSSWRCCRDTAA